MTISIVAPSRGSFTMVCFSLVPTVAATSVSEGQVVTQSDLIVEVIFTETMATEDLGVEDVMLVETYSNTVIPSDGFAYDPAIDMVTFTYEGLPDGLYQLTLSSGAEAFRDVAGRALDGAGDEGESRRDGAVGEPAKR